MRLRHSSLSMEEEGGVAVSRRLALTVLVGAATVNSRVSPADAAYGETSKPMCGKPKANTDFLPYNGDGFKLLIEREFPGQVLRYEDNFDAISNVRIIITPTDKKLITDFGSPEQFRSQVDFLLGNQAYLGKTDAEGGFESDAVVTANILQTAAPVISEKPYHFISMLTRSADSDKGGKHQLINAAVKDGNLSRALQTRSALSR